MQVTDAPEIHSNGFHVKFDISEGQIGFVLPTIVLPCDIDLFSRLASSDTDHLDDQCWGQYCREQHYHNVFRSSPIFIAFSSLA